MECTTAPTIIPEHTMGEFPIAWEETQSIDQLSDVCPYSIVEIEDYLFRNHYHWVIREEPTTFKISGPHSQRLDAERRYWVFEARNMTNRQQWYVVVGTGKSPFNPAERMKRWMYAKTNDEDLPPDGFLEQEYREQLVADARSR